MSTSDDDNLSSTTITTIISSSTTESISNDDEILPFIWDKLAFNKAKELLEINNNEINDEITRTADDEINYQLKESSNQLTSCVLLDLIDGKIQCCSKLTQNQRPLVQLVGIWEIDKTTFINAKAENKLSTLGVCAYHFNYDQNTLHTANLKKKMPIDNSWIYHRRCLFCNKYKYFLSCGNNCKEHSICIVGKNVQVPCTGLKACSVFNVNTHNDNTIIKHNNNEYRSRYICSQCFNLQGGHFFERQDTQVEGAPLSKIQKMQIPHFPGKWWEIVENAALR
ncbi:unnamed protein product [Rhizophagus irregularis]|nr:unnamed protein product [Rhizophagus irregularis]